MNIFKLPWYVDLVNYLTTGQMPSHWTKQDKFQFLAKTKYFFLDDPYMLKHCSDQIIRRRVPDDDFHSTIFFYHDHACEGHFSSKKKAAKILHYRFY